MNTKLLIGSLVLFACCLSNAYARDLLVEVIGGKVKRMDTFSSDPYMSVTVCNEKKQTPTISSTLNPVWNWKHQVSRVVLRFSLLFYSYSFYRRISVQKCPWRLSPEVSLVRWRNFGTGWHDWRNGDHGRKISQREDRIQYAHAWEEGWQQYSDQSQIRLTIIL